MGKDEAITEWLGQSSHQHNEPVESLAFPEAAKILVPSLSSLDAVSPLPRLESLETPPSAQVAASHRAPAVCIRHIRQHIQRLPCCEPTLSGPGFEMVADTKT